MHTVFTNKKYEEMTTIIVWDTVAVRSVDDDKVINFVLFLTRSLVMP